jgi:hypothetical protein
MPTGNMARPCSQFVLYQIEVEINSEFFGGSISAAVEKPSIF